MEPIHGDYREIYDGPAGREDVAQLRWVADWQGWAAGNGRAITGPFDSAQLALDFLEGAGVPEAVRQRLMQSAMDGAPLDGQPQPVGDARDGGDTGLMRALSRGFTEGQISGGRPADDSGLIT